MPIFTFPKHIKTLSKEITVRISGKHSVYVTWIKIETKIKSFINDNCNKKLA